MIGPEDKEELNIIDEDYIDDNEYKDDEIIDEEGIDDIDEE